MFASRTLLAGTPVQTSTQQRPAVLSRPQLIVRADQASAPEVARRAVLGLVVGGTALLGRAPASHAAYGDAARIFGSKPANTSGFIPYSGEGFALLLPSKWSPSKEREDPGVVLRYADNDGDVISNVAVIVKKTDKSSIEDLGDPTSFLKSISSLLGEQVFTGETLSEGGFLPGKVASASLLDVQKAKDKNNKTYYKYDLLTRTADNSEGGRHHLFTAAVGNGNLYICKVQIGDKRYFKGAKKDGEGARDSFVVA